MICFEKMTKENFFMGSLQGFIRHQEVYSCWRWEAGQWAIKPVRFTEQWGEEKLREMERDALEILTHGYGFMAVEGEQIRGFALVDSCPVGERGEYIELTDFQVSEPYRHRGIGGQLFKLAAEEAKRRGAEKLYISAHSSVESQGAYKALGCRYATWIYEKKRQAEPCDVQMEYVL